MAGSGLAPSRTATRRSAGPGPRILHEARAIVGPPPAPFRGEREAWEDRLGAVCLALVERLRGISRDPVAVELAERQRQRAIARKEAPMFASVTGDDLADE